MFPILKQNTVESNKHYVVISAASLTLSVEKGEEKEPDGTTGSDSAMEAELCGL